MLPEINMRGRLRQDPNSLFFPVRWLARLKLFSRLASEYPFQIQSEVERTAFAVKDQYVRMCIKVADRGGGVCSGGPKSKNYVPQDCLS